MKNYPSLLGSLDSSEWVLHAHQQLGRGNRCARRGGDFFDFLFGKDMRSSQLYRFEISLLIILKRIFFSHFRAVLWFYFFYFSSVFFCLYFTVQITRTLKLIRPNEKLIFAEIGNCYSTLLSVRAKAKFLNYTYMYTSKHSEIIFH